MNIECAYVSKNLWQNLGHEKKNIVSNLIIMLVDLMSEIVGNFLEGTPIYFCFKHVLFKRKGLDVA